MKSLFFNLKPVSHNYLDLFKTQLNGPRQQTAVVAAGQNRYIHTKLQKFPLIDKTMSPTINVSDAAHMLTTANTIKCWYKRVQDGG